MDRRDARRPRPPAAGGDRRLGLVHAALGHRHRDLARLPHPGVHLPGLADSPDGARLVRDPPLRLSRRRDVHAGARRVRHRRGAQQLRAREHGHVRDAPHVRGDRQRCDVPRCARGLRRPEDLLLHHRRVHLPLPLQCRRRLVRVPVREREGCAHQSPRPRHRHRSRRDLPRHDPRCGSSGRGSRRCGRRRWRGPRSSGTSART